MFLIHKGPNVGFVHVKVWCFDVLCMNKTGKVSPCSRLRGWQREKDVISWQTIARWKVTASTIGYPLVNVYSVRT